MKLDEIEELSLDEIQAEVQRRQGVMLLAALQRFHESYRMWDNYVDPREPYWDDPNGEPWEAIQGNDPDRISAGFENEEELRQARWTCRVLARENEFCISAMENRINYVAGTGHKYIATAATEGVSDKLLTQVNDFITEWCKENDWFTRQGEHQTRLDRDGEVFLRLFPSPDGLLRVRIVEPALITPPGQSARQGDPSDSFGIRTAPNDVERVIGYWLEGETLIPASEIQHRKANVDKNVKRGVPTYWPVRQNFDRAWKILRNMSVVTATQASIAMVRKLGNASRDAFGVFTGAAQDRARSSSRTGANQPEEDFTRPGRIINVRGDVDYEFPIVGVNAGGFVEVLDAEIRAIAARLVMPEWMFANARNNNYSSSLVAGSPAFRNFERLQSEMKEDDLAILWRAIEFAAEFGRGFGVPFEQIRQQVTLTATAPDLENIDPLQRTQRNQVMKQEGVLSVQTWSAKEGLDYDVEQENRKAHADEYGDLDAQGLPPAFEQKPGEEDEEA